MKILIINQPTNNRGDESAHRSLVRNLIRIYSSTIIHVVFLGENPDSIRQMKVDGKLVTYVCVPFGRGRILIPKLALKYRFERIIACLHPSFREMRKYIKSADLVICAPGGICMGLFQNWTHIFLLQLAKLYNKKVAYYSRSFGPFPIKTYDNRVFKKVSMRLLRGFDFLSIRDSKTMLFADEIGVDYIPAIDTTFLDTPYIEVPCELLSLIGGSEFVIYVPNTLIWHPAYKYADTVQIDKYYLSVMNILLKRYSTSKIIMLPQMFNCKEDGDVNYFRKLKIKSGSDRVIVIPECYGSDIQQTLISQSKLIVGSRYHSIVFAINNNVPFIALSYEHKIDGLLNILYKSEQKVDISKLGQSIFDFTGSLKLIERIIVTAKPDLVAKNKAKLIASECFKIFCEKYIEF